MSDTDGKPWLQRAQDFLLILVVTLLAFPLAAFALGPVLPRVIRNFMFFWPEVVLLPNGFMNLEIGGSRAFFMNSAIYGAIITWVLIAVLFGKVFRKTAKKKAAWLVIPVAVGLVITFLVLLYAFGYTVYSDGP